MLNNNTDLIAIMWW